MSFEDQHSSPQTDFEAARDFLRESLDKREKIKELLLALNNLSDQYVLSREEWEGWLKVIDEQLTLFEQEAGGDRNDSDDFDLLVLQTMYFDLQTDFESNRRLNLDSSFAELVGSMEDEIKEKGVRKESPDETGLRRQVKVLRDAGVSPEYVVASGDTDAPTIILFMQIHPNPGLTQAMLDDLGISDSQNRITHDISALMDRGVPLGTFYNEGSPAREELSQATAEESYTFSPMRCMASVRIKKEFGNKIHIEGIEDPELLEDTVRAVVEEDFEKTQYRTTAHNVLLASNIAKDISGNNAGLHLLVLGAGHEKALNEDSDEPLPISQTLAYYGINVIVVDAATQYDNPEKWKEKGEEVTAAFRNAMRGNDPMEQEEENRANEYSTHKLPDSFKKSLDDAMQKLKRAEDEK